MTLIVICKSIIHLFELHFHIGQANEVSKSENTIPILALFFSGIALIFTLMKDFIIPYLLKPKMKFKYAEKPPFRRESNLNGSNNKGCFLRFSVINIGKRPAKNCRCQISTIEKNSLEYRDYRGYTLRWASRPERVERLNIGIGETEFIDLAVTIDFDNNIHLETYHDVGIGICSTIEPGEYSINLIFSGDNFKPYKIKFRITKENISDRNTVTLSLIEGKKKYFK